METESQLLHLQKRRKYLNVVGKSVINTPPPPLIHIPQPEDVLTNHGKLTPQPLPHLIMARHSVSTEWPACLLDVYDVIGGKVLTRVNKILIPRRRPSKSDFKSINFD